LSPFDYGRETHVRGLQDLTEVIATAIFGIILRPLVRTAFIIAGIVLVGVAQTPSTVEVRVVPKLT
jgi:hypothetical protein